MTFCATLYVFNELVFHLIVLYILNLFVLLYVKIFSMDVLILYRFFYGIYVYIYTVSVLSLNKVSMWFKKACLTICEELPAVCGYCLFLGQCFLQLIAFQTVRL